MLEARAGEFALKFSRSQLGRCQEYDSQFVEVLGAQLKWIDKTEQNQKKIALLE